MAEMVCARAKTSDSADLTMTREWLVIKGKHYQVQNNYFHAAEGAQAFSVKDVLSMDYLTIRSKRAFILFLILMTIVLFGGVGVRKMLSATRQIDKEAQKIENVYNLVAGENVDINITGTIKGFFSEIGAIGIILLYVVLIIGSAGCLLYYFFRPFRVLYVSTLGMIISVERRFYDKTQLDSIVNMWKMQLW